MWLSHPQLVETHRIRDAEHRVRHTLSREISLQSVSRFDDRRFRIDEGLPRSGKSAPRRLDRRGSFHWRRTRGALSGSRREESRRRWLRRPQSERRARLSMRHRRSRFEESGARHLLRGGKLEERLPERPETCSQPLDRVTNVRLGGTPFGRRRPRHTLAPIDRFEGGARQAERGSRRFSGGARRGEPLARRFVRIARRATRG